MKRLLYTITALMLTIAASAQTLNVKVGNVTYLFPAADAGDMTYTDGSTLTIMGKTFSLSEVSQMTVDNSEVSASSVAVSYDGSQASVTVSGDVAQYVTPTVSGAHVSIAQSEDLAQEITYTLSGTSTDGGFYMSGSYKATLVLNGLTLTNQSAVYSGAAIHVQNGKRINIKLTEGTTNTLADISGGSQKGCLYVKGHAEFKQKGTLYVTGNTKHAIKAGEYISVKNAKINVLSAVGDGISCNQYFLMESGTVNIENTTDDGIQCDLDGTTSTGQTSDHEDEDTGNIYISGGTININCPGTAAKGIKAQGDIAISGGTIDVTTTGDGTWDTDDLDTKAACGISADGNIDITGGNITLTATGSGGKGMKCDGTLTVSDSPVINITTSGNLYYNDGTTENKNYTGDTDRVNSDYYSSPKGIKAGLKDTSTSQTKYSGGIVINGGTINITTTGNNAEGMESKNTLYIKGGDITVNSHDDGINSAREMYLQGGTVTVVAANNDAIDSNANLYIEGGTVIALGAGGAECGLDAAEGYSLYITGGNVLAVGANNNAVSSKSGSQALLSTTGTITANSTVSVKSGSTTLASFAIPSTYTGSQGGGGGPMFAPPGGGGGFQPGGNKSNILISCAGLTSGTTYSVSLGSTSNNVKATTYTSGGFR